MAPQPEIQSDCLYRDILASLPDFVGVYVPNDAALLVISRGDELLLDLPVASAEHFPQAEKHQYAGHHPATGAEAVDQLRRLVRNGAQYLVIPATAEWWLDYYSEFAAYLGLAGELVKKAECGSIYSLRAGSVTRLKRDLVRRVTGSKSRLANVAVRSHASVVNTSDVSVVVTSHNKGEFLAEALRSVAQQTHPAFEVLVVDDASDDDTTEVSQTEKVRCVTVNLRSPALARNHGAALTSGKHLCFLDGDDVLAPDFLEQHVAALGRSPQSSFAYGRIREFGERNHLWPAQPWDHDLLRRRNYVPAATVIRRRAFEYVSGYPDLTGAEDWGLWIKLSHAGPGGVSCNARWLWRRTVHSRNWRRTAGRERSWFEEAPLSCLQVSSVLLNRSVEAEPILAEVAQTNSSDVVLFCLSQSAPVVGQGQGAPAPLLSHLNWTIQAVSLQDFDGITCCVLIRQESLRDRKLRVQDQADPLRALLDGLVAEATVTLPSVHSLVL